MATLVRLDKKKDFGGRLIVAGSGRIMHCARGNQYVVRVAVFDESGAVLDLTDHSSLNLSYMPASRTSAAIATKTASIEDATFTEAQFLAGTHYHAEFTFTETDMNPSLGGALYVDYWIVCFGIKTVGGGEVTHGGGVLRVEEDGTDNTVTPPDPPAVGITAAQAATLINDLALDNPMTTAGDLIRGGASGVPTRLPIGSEGQVLKVVSGALAWASDATSSVVNNFAATTDPGTGDDSGDGYSVGSQWLNTSTDKLFVCQDATLTAAVWERIDQDSGILNNFAATADPAVTDDSGDGYSVGSRWINLTTDKTFTCTDASVGAAVWVWDNEPAPTGYLKADGSVAGTAVQEVLGINFADAAELTIATGAVTATQSLHTIDTEADASSDDLDTITAAKGIGDFLILVPAHTDRTVVLKHGTGNIRTASAADITLDNTDKGVMLVRVGSNWVVFGNERGGGIDELVSDTTPQLGGTLDSNAKQIRESKGADVTAATTLTLGDDGNYFDIIGEEVSITSIATKGVGTRVRLHFDGIHTLTHHATDLVLPTEANITTAAGDEAIFIEYAAGDWRCVGYQRANGNPLAGGGDLVNDTTPQLGGTLEANAKQIRESKGADVASGATLTVGDDGNYFDITGSATITAIATKAVGTRVTLHFDAVCTLTHHATDLILPGGSNIVTAAGDEAVFIEYAAGDWRCISYQRADGMSPKGVEMEIQAYTGGVQQLTTTDADVAGSSITYTRKYTSALIKYAFNFQVAPGDSVGQLSIKFYVGGVEQTAWRKSVRLPTDDGVVHFEGYYSSSGSGNLGFKLQAREFGASNEVKVHETTLWDAGASNQSSGAVLTITEIQN